MNILIRRKGRAAVANQKGKYHFYLIVFDQMSMQIFKLLPFPLKVISQRQYIFMIRIIIENLVGYLTAIHHISLWNFFWKIKLLI